MNNQPIKSQVYDFTTPPSAPLPSLSPSSSFFSKTKKIIFSLLLIIFILFLAFFLMKQKLNQYKMDLENVPPTVEEWSS